jgi:hypothetical protein
MFYSISLMYVLLLRVVIWPASQQQHQFVIWCWAAAHWTFILTGFQQRIFLLTIKVAPTAAGCTMQC